MEVLNLKAKKLTRFYSMDYSMDYSPYFEYDFLNVCIKEVNKLFPSTKGGDSVVFTLYNSKVKGCVEIKDTHLLIAKYKFITYRKFWFNKVSRPYLLTEQLQLLDKLFTKHKELYLVVKPFNERVNKNASD